MRRASRQMVRFGVGVVLMIAIAVIDIRFWLKVSYALYAMAFVLLATVVSLMSFMPIPSVVPTARLLLGIGVACWRLGTVVVIVMMKKKEISNEEKHALVDESIKTINEKYVDLLYKHDGCRLL